MIYVRHKSHSADVEPGEVPDEAYEQIFKAKGWVKVDPDADTKQGAKS